MFRSTDGGDNWQQINQGLTDLRVTTVGVSPAFDTDDTLFAGTNGGGVFRSTDGGGNWQEVSQGLTNTNVRALGVSPAFATDSTLFAGTFGGGAFRSTDGGDTWEEFNQGLSNPRVNALGLSPAFATDDTLFAGTFGGGVFRWDPTPCTLNMGLSYEVGTLFMNFELGTREPALWRLWLVVPSIGVIPLWSAPLPAIPDPVDIPISFPLPSLGTVGFLTTLNTAEGISCWDFGLVDTGLPSASTPSAQELRELIPQPSAVIPVN